MSSSSSQDSTGWIGTGTSFEKPTARNSSRRARSAVEPDDDHLAGIDTRGSFADPLCVRLGHLGARVEHHRAEVLGSMARPASAAAFSTITRPSATIAGVQKLGSHPSASSPDPAQLRRRAATEPHVERLLHRERADRDALVVEAGPVVVDRCPRSRAGA